MTSVFPIDDPILVLVGPTAIGKTALSLEISKNFKCEIVGLDSMQVYRYMDIGTAKASAEEMGKIPHHLINIIDPDEEYDASKYETDAVTAIKEIQHRGNIPLITGGTGLYLRALLNGLFDGAGNFHDIRTKLKSKLTNLGISSLHKELIEVDPAAAERIHQNDIHRVLRALEIYHGTGVTWSAHLKEQGKKKTVERFNNKLLLGLTCERKVLYDRINMRSELMMKQGLREEVVWLLKNGFTKELKSMQSIGYKHMIHLIEGEWSLEETIEKLARDTRRYAKRQFTWFSKMDLEWFQQQDDEAILSRIASFLHG